MLPILVFVAAHWGLAAFFQSFYLHRFGAHRMFTMRAAWDRVFHVCTLLAQGSSYLRPAAYAVLHREHHAYADTARDPHSPRHHGNIFRMMWRSRARYIALARGGAPVEPQFAADLPAWPALERIGDSWASRIAFGIGYAIFYFAFAPHWAWLLLLPLHFLLGPVQGAVVNWFGHRVGYRNFATGDDSRNSTPVDLLVMGELFQNNHHQHGGRPNFGARWFELDPTWWAIRCFAWLRVIRLRAAVAES